MADSEPWTGCLTAALACALWFVLAGCDAPAGPRLQAPSPQPVSWAAAVGELEVGSSALHCSAVLVAPDTIVTAAHCLFLGSANVPASPTELTFHPNLGALPALPPSQGVAYKGLGGVIRGGKLRNAEVPRDWAMITIDPPVTIVQPLPVANLPVSGMLQLIASGNRLVTAGYGNGAYDELRLHPPCRIVPQRDLGMVPSDAMVVTDCGFASGDAGGPILLIDGAGQPALVGIIVGSGRSPKNAALLGLGVNARNFSGALHQDG